MVSSVPADAETNSAVLITGGSGYLGTPLSHYLADKKLTIVSMYRHRIPEPYARVFPVCSDLSSCELLAAPLRGVHTVVHLAWENTFTGPNIIPDETSFSDSAMQITDNLKGLKNLLKAMVSVGTRRLIFISAQGAARESDNPFLKEKYTAEFYILNSGIPEVVILRPSVVFGGEENRNRFINAIKRLMRFPGFYPVPAWKSLIYPLALSDFNQIVYGCIKSERLNNPFVIMDISGENGYHIEEIFRIVSGRDGKGARVPLGRLLGRTLLPIVERDFRSQKHQTSIFSFLPICRQALNDSFAKEELKKIYSGPYESFTGKTSSDA